MTYLSSHAWRTTFAAVVIMAVLGAGALVAIPAGAASTAGSAAEADAGVACPSGATANQRFVYAVYSDVLHRCADTGGVTYWTAAIGSGTSRSQVAAAILLSTESITQEVASIYSTFAGAAPTSQELGQLAAQLRQTRSETDLWASVLGSDTYHSEVWDGESSTCTLPGLDPAEQPSAADGADGCFVAGVYDTLLNRLPTGSGYDYWLASIKTGTGGSSTVATRSQMVRAVYGSAESIHRVIASVYEGYLGRSVDASGGAYWQAYLTRTHQELNFLILVLGSSEYFSKAQTVPATARRAAAKARGFDTDLLLPTGGAPAG